MNAQSEIASLCALTTQFDALSTKLNVFEASLKVHILRFIAVLLLHNTD